MAISTAISLERRERVIGYEINKGFFDVNPGVLPQVISIFAEANRANQGGLSTIKREITSAQEAGEIYGFGSPIHSIMRILRPSSGDGVGGIPTVVFPQESDENSSATSHSWTVDGSANRNATHTFVIGGRRSVDFVNYSYSVSRNDTSDQIAAKIGDSINSVLSSPVEAVVDGSVITLTTKWNGATSAGLKTRVDNNGTDAGISYSQTSIVEGSGTVQLAPALSQFGSTWYTLNINSYGASVLDELEAFNGTPEEKTGLFAARTFRPFISFFGTTLDQREDITAITDNSARIEQVTNVHAPAPKSEGFGFEAAANACFLVAVVAQNTPALDVNDMPYPDMPIPSDEVIGDMSDYNNRDFLLKRGSSTVILENGAYRVQSMVTTYHKQGEDPLQYNYTRNLLIDYNIKDIRDILVKRNVIDHVILEDDQSTSVAKSVKPKQWKGVLFEMYDNLAEDGLITDAQFSKDSLRVEISETNPNRFDEFHRYKRSGLVRISSATVEAGF